jgi:hypothetical protein
MLHEIEAFLPSLSLFFVSFPLFKIIERSFRILSVFEARGNPVQNKRWLVPMPPIPYRPIRKGGLHTQSEAVRLLPHHLPVPEEMAPIWDASEVGKIEWH